MNRNFKIFAITVIVLFSLVIVSPWVLHLSLGDEISDEGNGGLTEKRELAKFPTSFSNNFFSKFNSFYEDHSPFRNNIIAFETRLSQSYETYYRKTISPKLTDLLIKPEETPAPNTVMPGETATPSPTINIDILSEMKHRRRKALLSLLRRSPLPPLRLLPLQPL